MPQAIPAPELPNRQLFLQALIGAIARSQRKGLYLAVLCLQVEATNVASALSAVDQDALHTQVSARLRQHIRQGDVLGKIDPDQYVILLEPIIQTKDIVTVAQKLLIDLQATYDIAGTSLKTPVSIGIAVYPNEGTEAENLLHASITAMTKARQQGGACFLFFQEQLHAQATARIQLEQQLKQAVQDAQFDLFYQPQFSFLDNKLVGVEALLRWRRAHEIQTAGGFFSVADEAGVTPFLSKWMLEKSCRQVAQWRSKGLINADLNIAVNLSSQQLHKGLIEKIILEAIEISQIDSNNLTIEINDQILEDDFDTACKVIDYIDRLGVKVTLENFGIDRLSLLQLAQLPIHQIKIAPSIIHNLTTDDRYKRALDCIMVVAQQLDIQIVATAIETQAQYALLDACGCDVGQGFYLQAPMPELEMTSLLRQHQHTL